MSSRAGLTSVLVASLAIGCSNSDPAKGPGGLTGTAGRKFFLPTGDEARNTTGPSIEVDAYGNTHFVYAAYAFGDAFYAFCPGACSSPDEVSVVKFETEGTVANVMLALDSEGRPQVLMSTFLRVYYARCEGDCTQPSGWTQSVILEHGSDREVTGEAFALTADGKPRFVTHVYRAYLGIGQKEPGTFYAVCDGDCTTPGAWQYHRISDQIWQESTLRFSADGTAHLATIATVRDDAGSQDIAAYLSCSGGCEDGDAWTGSALYPSFSDPHVELIDPAISMALTSSGAPRITLLGKGEDGSKQLVYAECDQDCTQDASWRGSVLIQSSELGAGVDVALDQGDRVRIAYTASGSILMPFCDADCGAAEAPWQLGKVELGNELPPDDIFLYPNCNVAAWFLRHPSLAFGPDGLPRVGYRAEDISGGWSNPDPNQPDCVAGADMTLSRYAALDELRAQ